MVSYERFARFLEGGRNGKPSNELHYNWVIGSKWYANFKKANAGKLPSDFDVKFKEGFIKAFNKNQFVTNINATTNKEGFVNHPGNSEILEKLANNYIQYATSAPAGNSSEGLYSKYAQKIVNNYINNASNQVTSAPVDFINKFKVLFNNYIKEKLPVEPKREAYDSKEEYQLEEKAYKEDYENFVRNLISWINTTLPSVEGQSHATPGELGNKEPPSNPEFTTHTKVEIDKIGHDEIKNHLPELQKFFDNIFGKGHTTIEYKGILEKAQESLNFIKGSRLQEFKKFQEEENNPGGNDNVSVDTKKLNSIKNILKNEDSSGELKLPQTLVFRASFDADTMYWVFRSFDDQSNEDIGSNFNWAESAESSLNLGSSENGEKQEESVETDRTLSVLQEAELYLSKLREAEEAEDEALNNIKKEISSEEESSQENPEEKKEENTSEKIKVEPLSAYQKNGKKRSKAYKEGFVSAIEDTKEKIVSHLQDLRAAKVIKLPGNQQMYYPNFEAAQDEEAQKRGYLTENVINTLKRIKSEIEELKIDPNVVEIDKEQLKAILEELAKKKSEILNLSKNPDNCYVDIKINMIAGNKKPSIFKRMSAALGGKAISSSAKKWQAFFSGNGV